MPPDLRSISANLWLGLVAVHVVVLGAAVLVEQQDLHSHVQSPAHATACQLPMLLSLQLMWQCNLVPLLTIHSMICNAVHSINRVVPSEDKTTRAAWSISRHAVFSLCYRGLVGARSDITKQA